jgi:RNA polymerase sigma-70 factor (ECF subfamily)
MGLHLYRETEAELIAACCQGNSSAQRQLYQRYAGRLFAICCRYVKDRMEAEDVFITGFNKIFTRLGQYRGEGSFEGWMKRIMVNEALSCLRRLKQLNLNTGLEAVGMEAEYQPPPDLLETGELLQMVAGLPSGYRTVFNLYAIEGYSHEEIGAMLGISENTSKSQLSRARALLAKQLEARENQIKKKVMTNQTA